MGLQIVRHDWEHSTYLLYNVVSFCCTARWISCVCTCITSLLSLLLTPLSHPSGLSQDTKLSSLWYTPASHQLSVLHMVVYICQSQPPSSSQLCIHVCSLYLHLSSCPANRRICTTFLDSTDVLMSIFFWLTSLCMTVSRCIHSSGNDPMSLYLLTLNLVICVSLNTILSITLKETLILLFGHTDTDTNLSVGKILQFMWMIHKPSYNSICGF